MCLDCTCANEHPREDTELIADTLCAVNYFSCLELANSNTHTIETHEVHTRIMHISICGETRLYL